VKYWRRDVCVLKKSFMSILKIVLCAPLRPRPRYKSYMYTAARERILISRPINKSVFGNFSLSLVRARPTSRTISSSREYESASPANRYFDSIFTRNRARARARERERERERERDLAGEGTERERKGKSHLRKRLTFREKPAT